MKVVIILPTYNEKNNVEKLISHLQENIFPHIKNHTMAILVVDDNSPDKTADAVKNMMKKWKNIDISEGPKHGLGAAYVRGMTYAINKMNADIMFEMDADGQHDPKKIHEFLGKIDEGYDMVIGTRYSDGGSIPENWPPQRKAFSIVGNVIVRAILMRFHIHDWTGGYRAIRKEVFLKEKEELTNFKGYTFQVSFLHKAVRDGFKIAEVPFHFADRTLGKSKIAPAEYIVDLLKYVITARIRELARFIKFLIVGGTGFLFQISMQELSIAFGISLFIAILLSSFISIFTVHSDIIALSHATGAAIGAESAIISNFLLNNFWTFQDRRLRRGIFSFFRRFIKFNLTSLASVIIQFTAVWIGEKFLGPILYIEKIPVFGITSIATRTAIVVPTIVLIIIPLNYLIYNTIIWKKKRISHETNTKT